MLQLSHQQQTVVVTLRNREPLLHRPMMWALAASLLLHLAMLFSVDVTTLLKEKSWHPRQPVSVGTDLGCNAPITTGNLQPGGQQLLTQLWMQPPVISTNESRLSVPLPRDYQNPIDTALLDADFSVIEELPYLPEPMQLPLYEVTPRVRIQMMGSGYSSSLTPQIDDETTQSPLELPMPLDCVTAHFSIQIAADEGRVCWAVPMDEIDVKLEAMGTALIKKIRFPVNREMGPIVNGELEIQLQLGAGESFAEVLKEVQKTL